VAKKPDPDRPVRERPANPDDQWVDALRESCARAMAAHLKQSVNTVRPINSMTLLEMMSLAEACTSHWIVQVSQKIGAEELSPTQREYTNLLLG
jgi:hypothetical protein